jgi:hypothetical protein
MLQIGNMIVTGDVSRHCNGGRTKNKSVGMQPQAMSAA